MYVSPRNGRTTSTTEMFKIVEHGIQPSMAQARPPTNLGALWSGTEIGGNGIDTFEFDQIGRLPNDLHARPSTPSTCVVHSWTLLE